MSRSRGGAKEVERQRSVVASLGVRVVSADVVWCASSNPAVKKIWSDQDLSEFSKVNLIGQI